MEDCPQRLIPQEEWPREGFPGDGCVCRSHTREAELGQRADRCLLAENDPDPNDREGFVKQRAWLASVEGEIYRALGVRR